MFSPTQTPLCPLPSPQSMLDTLDDFRPAEVAQVLWGMARLGVHPGGTFLAEVVDAVQWRLQHYATQVRKRRREGTRMG